MSLGQIRREWTAERRGPTAIRRGLYTYFWRATPHPALVVFDAPDATRACTRRMRSNTPLQALTLLNDPAFIEFAGALADRVLREGPADDAGPARPRLPPRAGPAARPRRVAAAGRACSTRRPARSDPEPGGLDDRGPGPAQSRRVHHPGMTATRSDEARAMPAPDPLLDLTRRHFFERCGARARLDGAGLAAGRGRPRPPRPRRRTRWRPARPLPGEGEERHLPVHGRRPEPVRAVRAQAEAPGVPRPADPRVVRRRASGSPS